MQNTTTTNTNTIQTITQSVGNNKKKKQFVFLIKKN